MRCFIIIGLTITFSGVKHTTDSLDLILDPQKSVKRREDLDAARKQSRKVLCIQLNQEEVNNVRVKAIRYCLINRQTYANMDMENSYKALFELLWNSQIPCFDVMNVTSKSNYEYGKFQL